MIRVAISSPSSSCPVCNGFGGTDVPCGFCQHVYFDKTEAREYADYTVGYYDTEREATFIVTAVEEGVNKIRKRVEDRLKKDERLMLSVALRIFA
jgi:hypothetical protein